MEFFTILITSEIYFWLMEVWYELIWYILQLSIAVYLLLIPVFDHLT
jgi:hypothetical protein